MMNFILIVGLNCCITHALKANPVICIDMLKNFWLSPKVNRSEAEGAGSIDAKIQGKILLLNKPLFARC
ncbi:hypothetical protein Hanom_Chr05g00440501 [Helianthus anomalus]